MQTRQSADRQYAEFHSLFAADFRKDLPLYLDLAAKYAGPVLEIGCSTGRVLMRLGEEGYEALGVDVSRPMLEVARRNLEPWQDRIRLADFDFRQGALFEKFDVVFATLYAFNQLIDVEEQRLFLRHVSRCMKSPGVLALDCFCPLPMLRPEANGQWREIERSYQGRQLKVRDKREMLTPLLERRTQVFSIDGGPPAEHVAHRRYLPPQQAEQLLAEAGFESIRLLPGLDAEIAMIPLPGHTTGHDSGDEELLLEHFVLLDDFVVHGPTA
jgi:SAM-dependent methyltransferase